MKLLQRILARILSTDELAKAAYSYMAMESPAKQIKLILASPEILKFKKVSSSVVYRAISMSKKQYREFMEGKIPLVMKPSIIVAVSESKDGAIAARDSFELESKRTICFKKNLIKKDVVVNFTAFAKSLEAGEASDYYEREIWMKPSSYYLSYSKKELVYDGWKDELYN